MVLYIYPVVVILILWIWSSSLTKAFKKVPPGPRPLPIIGNLHQLGKNPHESLYQMYLKYGKIIKIKFGGVDTIVLTEPDILKEAFIEKGPVFISRFLRASRTACNKNDNIVNSNGETWRHLRMLASSELTNLKLKKFEYIISDEASKLVDKFMENEKLGVAEEPNVYIKMCSLNVILRIIFGIGYPYDIEGKNYRLVELIHTNFKNAGAPFLSDFIPVLYPFFKDKPKAFFDSYFEFHAYVTKIAEERLKTMDDENPKDFLEGLLVRYKNNELSLNNIITTCIDLILAGTDTTANTIIFIVLMMANNPEMQERLYKEVTENLQDGYTYTNDKHKTPYLNAVIKETMRKFPVAPLSVPHITTEDIQLKGYFIEKGTQVIQNIYATHRSEEFWTEPNKFNPDRFLNMTPENKNNLVTFGIGGRNCLGLNLAEYELFLITSTLFRSLKFKRVSEDLISEDCNFGLALHANPFQNKRLPPGPLPLGSIETIVLTEHDVLKEAFIDNGKVFMARFPKPSRTKLTREENIGNSNGEYWRHLRMLASSELTNLKVKKFEHYIGEEGNGLLAKFRENAKLGICEKPHDYVHMCSLNIILRFLFGLHYPYNSESRSSELVKLIYTVVEIGFPTILSDVIPILHPFMNETPKHFYTAFWNLRDYVTKIAEDRLKTMDDDNPKDFIEGLLLRLKEGELILGNVVGICIDLIVAASDTTANTITFLILILATYPEVQEKVYKEITENLEDGCKYADGKGKTPYFSSVLKELMRRFPVAPLAIPHTVTEDTELRGYFIPKGSQIFSNVYGTHNNDKYWEDPFRFIPERFLEGHPDSKKQIFPFNLGPRQCIGLTLAEHELFTIATILIRNIKFIAKTPFNELNEFKYDALQPPDFEVYYEAR
eukprot:gene12017-14698_t